MTQALLTPFQPGPHLLTNRIVMAPLTRMRSLAGNTPGPINAERFARKAEFNPL